MMTFHQKIFALIAAFLLLTVILELVRRRKIREEYSWLWMLISFLVIVLVFFENLLGLLSRLIGAENDLTTLFLFSLFFLIALDIHYSIKISLFTGQIKKTAQDVGILTKNVEEIKSKKKV